MFISGCPGAYEIPEVVLGWLIHKNCFEVVAGQRSADGLKFWPENSSAEAIFKGTPLRKLRDSESVLSESYTSSQEDIRKQRQAWRKWGWSICSHLVSWATTGHQRVYFKSDSFYLIITHGYMSVCLISRMSASQENLGHTFIFRNYKVATWQHMWVKSRNGSRCGFLKSQPALPEQVANNAAGKSWWFLWLRRCMSLFSGCL